MVHTAERRQRPARRAYRRDRAGRSRNGVARGQIAGHAGTGRGARDPIHHEVGVAFLIGTHGCFGSVAGDAIDGAAIEAERIEFALQVRQIICRGRNRAKQGHPAVVAFEDQPRLAFGGKATLKSYGVNLRGQNYTGLSRQLAEKMPASHRAFLEGLPTSVRFGDYFFCHAGIRPGVPLDAQVPEDLMWIRGEFLNDRRDHGAVIVHGHTPTGDARPEVRPNRIDIDTGCVYGGPLTCLVLESIDVRFL